MHICDKCKKFNQCYTKSGNDTPDIVKRAKVTKNGCRSYRELTIEEMFGIKNGGRSNGKNEQH